MMGIMFKIIANCYWSTCSKSENWAIVYLCVRGINCCLFIRFWYLIFKSFWQFGIFVFPFITMFTLLTFYYDVHPVDLLLRCSPCWPFIAMFTLLTFYYDVHPVDFLLRCSPCWPFTHRWKHLHDRIISLRGQVWAHRTSLSSQPFIEVPVPYQVKELSCICLLGVWIIHLSTIFLCYSGTLPTGCGICCLLLCCY
jgi:hypothetical protein